MSTRGWVTVNVFWVVTRGQDEFRLVPPEFSEKFQLCPHASSFHKTEADKVPPPIHVSYLKIKCCPIFLPLQHLELQ